MDEAAGDVVYDLSHSGFTYNNNNGRIYDAGQVTSPIGFLDSTLLVQINWAFWGVTDTNGNYIISAIPYSGAGETYTITPVLGIHQFDPTQQLVYIGETNTVINSVNFIDTSSFTFKGKVFYDSRGVFKSFVEVNSSDPNVPDFTGLTDGDEYVSGPGLMIWVIIIMKKAV